MCLVLFLFLFIFFFSLPLCEKCKLVFFPLCTSWLDTLIFKDKQYVFTPPSGICQQEGGFCFMSILSIFKVYQYIVTECLGMCVRLYLAAVKH